MLHTCTWKKPKCYIHVHGGNQNVTYTCTYTRKKPKCYIHVHGRSQNVTYKCTCTQKKPKCYIHVHRRNQNVTYMYMEEAKMLQTCYCTWKKQSVIDKYYFYHGFGLQVFEGYHIRTGIL